MYLIAKHKINQSSELHWSIIKMKKKKLIVLNIIYLNIVIIHKCHDSPNEYKIMVIVEY